MEGIRRQGQLPFLNMAGSTCIRILLCLMCLVFSPVSPGAMLAAQEKATDGWIEDIDLLGMALEEKHPDLYHRMDPPAFRRELATVAAHTGDRSLFGLAVRLQQAVAGLGDAHTAVNYHFLINKENILPLEFFWFEEGIIVMKTARTCSRIMGKKLVSVNGFPVEQVIDSLATLLVSQNPSLIKAETVRMIPWAQLLQHFGFAGEDGVTMDFGDAGVQGERVHFPLPVPEDHSVAVEPDSVPEGWKERKAYFRDRYFPGENLYYIQYNHCWSREVEEKHGSGAGALFMPSFREFEKRVFRHLRREEIDRLVIDLRFNGGGEGSQGSAFIEKLSRSKFNGKGKICVIQGRNTSSTGLIHLDELRRKTDAVTVGEPTGGRPNHFGEVRRFVLPETGLVVNYPTCYHRLAEGDPPTIRPDIEVPLCFRDYMSGIDAFLQAARKPGAYSSRARPRMIRYWAGM